MASFNQDQIVTLVAVGGILVAFAGFVWVARRGRRLHPRAPDDGTGLRGWLVLLAIGVTLLPAKLLVAFLSGFGGLDDLRAVPNGLLAFWIETTIIGVQFCLSIVVAVAFWRRRRAFKRGFIVLWALLTAFALLDPVFVSVVFGVPLSALLDREAIRNVVGNVVSVLWVFYVLRSRRVAARFTRGG